jgi:hypothetical protein
MTQLLFQEAHRNCYSSKMEKYYLENSKYFKILLVYVCVSTLYDVHTMMKLPTDVVLRTDSHVFLNMTIFTSVTYGVMCQALV